MFIALEEVIPAIVASTISLKTSDCYELKGGMVLCTSSRRFASQFVVVTRLVEELIICKLPLVKT